MPNPPYGAPGHDERLSDALHAPAYRHAQAGAAPYYRRHTHPDVLPPDHHFLTGGWAHDRPVGVAPAPHIGRPMAGHRAVPGHRRPPDSPPARIRRRRRTRAGRFLHRHRGAFIAAAIIADIVFYVAALLSACIRDNQSTALVVGINMVGLGALAGIVAWSRRD